MESLTIVNKSSDITWDYDEEADVLYLSIGQPREALAVDVGEGILLRYHETDEEVVGITIMGLRHRLWQALPARERSRSPRMKR